MATILLIDDDENLAESVSDDLKAAGHAVEHLEGAEPGLDRLKAKRFDVVLVDNMMPRMTGLEFLTALGERGIKTPVILMTGESTAETAIQATRRGAFSYVIKGDTFSDIAKELLPLIKMAVEIHTPVPGVDIDRKRKSYPDDGLALISNRSRLMVEQVAVRIGQLADSCDPVLILGERGTGKELVARALHTNSSRRERPFTVINCGSIPATLIESQLFGHEANAFTGAKLHKGWFEQTDGGTLFLDEIGEMPFDLQAKLLRVLQPLRNADGSLFQEFERVSGTQKIRVNVRVISATNQNLNAMIEAGRFRADLRDRLNCQKIDIPPLHARMDDLPDLVDYFLYRAAQAAGRSGPAISPQALDKLQTHPWPGNVRELQNVICRAFVRCRGPRILPADIVFEQIASDKPATTAPAAVPTTEDEARAALRKVLAWAWETTREDVWDRVHDLLECELLRLALEKCKGNQSVIAKRVGMARGTIGKRMDNYGLE